MNIQIWLDTFFTAWTKHDVEGVLDLFADGVEYWETPYLRLMNKKELYNEWQYIVTQSNIIIEHTIFAVQDNKYAVSWQLKYTNQSYQRKEFAGVYLMSLDENGRCFYFFQSGEERL